MSNLSIYPNPVSGDDLFIRLSETSEQAVQIDLFTTLGQLVRTEQFYNHSKTNELIFPVNNLKTGTYLLRVSFKGKTESFKLQIK